MNYQQYLQGREDYFAGRTNLQLNKDYKLGYADAIAEHLIVGDTIFFYSKIGGNDFLLYGMITHICGNLLTIENITAVNKEHENNSLFKHQLIHTISQENGNIIHTSQLFADMKQH